ncbi:MAG: AAA family ATPase [Bacteroidota bacterium]
MNSLSIINMFAGSFPFAPTDGQRKVIVAMADFLSSPQPDTVFLLKGYAGTGKTTLVSTLVKILPRLGMSSVLLAPTGRAAKVFSNYSGQRAFTIHKKIYRPTVSSEGSVSVSLMPNQHKNTLFIVDEASMIPDVAASPEQMFSSGRSLLEDLFYYVFSGEDCHLILVGDSAQLPPVGITLSPALDEQYINKNFNFNTRSAHLTEVVRQSLESGILFNATRIREQIAKGSCQPPFFDLHDHSDVIDLKGSELEEVLETLISRNDSENTVVITRSNKRANLFNEGIRNRILYREEEIAAGDLIMAVKNNYFWLPDDAKAGFIANGDMLEILTVIKRTEIFGFHFAEVRVRMLDYPDEPDLEILILLDTLRSESPALSQAENIRFFNEVIADYADVPDKRHRIQKVKNNKYYNAVQVKFAWSLTCHKTQGGQWPNVIVDQGYLTDEMVNTEYLRWLYTAMTRATGKLYLLNFQEKFYQ